jgi:dolichyl-phosphate-mannose-protein mannosyltransferase
MQTVDDLEISFTEFRRPEADTDRGWFDRLESKKLIIIIVVAALALGIRIYMLDAAGFAEDETNKIFAIRAYEQGDFTVNAEHPMLMKMLCYASVHTAALWNQAVGVDWGLAISEESALRLPNATFGALTVIPLFLLTVALLGFRIGLITSLLYAFGLNTIWFNRVVKEDTLLVFFIFTGFYLYNRAKETRAKDVARQERLYALAGAAFGLMMCSKYFPHFFGFNMLFYHLAGYDRRNNRPLTRQMMLKFFGAMLLAFVAFNPIIFSPQTWRYLLSYVNEDLITHHGYLMMDKLFSNDPGQGPTGSPWYFYYLYLGVKTPLPVITAFLVGLVEVFRRRGTYPDSRGYLFLRMMLFFWLVPMAFTGAKFLRYTLTLMPLVYMTAAVGMVMMWRMISSGLKKLSISHAFAPLAAGCAIGAVFVVAPAITTIRNMPYPSLYLNAIGGERAGYFFPHDEFYDLGARESIKHIAETAPRGAVIATEIPGVVQYYLERYDRPDIRSEIISHPEFTLARTRPDYVLLQRGRVYFENLEDFEFVESNFREVQASEYAGAPATRLYNITGRWPAAATQRAARTGDIKTADEHH